MSRRRGRIEVLTIGDELLEGRLVDSNAGHISDRLHRAGFVVDRHVSVADDPRAIVCALREAARRADAVLVSGGLGPTSDDLTAECVAEAVGVPLERRSEAVEHLERFFSFRGREMAPSNLKQADLPVGATILPNPKGTAVGFAVGLATSCVYCMPGVPQELAAMLEDAVLPGLCERLPHRPPKIATLKIFGLGESDVAQRLEGDQPLEATAGELVIQYRATFPEIHVRLMLNGGSDDALAGLLETARGRIGPAVYAAGTHGLPASLAEAVVDTMTNRNGTVGVMDAFSGGRFCGAVVDWDRQNRVLAGAEVIPGLDGDVETEARRAMDRWSSTHGVALSEGAEPGSAVVAVCDGVTTDRRDLTFPFPRKRMRRLAAWAAFELLRRRIGPREARPRPSDGSSVKRHQAVPEV